MGRLAGHLADGLQSCGPPKWAAARRASPRPRTARSLACDRGAIATRASSDGSRGRSRLVAHAWPAGGPLVVSASGLVSELRS